MQPDGMCLDCKPQQTAVSEKEEITLQAIENKQQLEELESAVLALQEELEQSQQNLMSASGEIKLAKEQLASQSIHFTQQLAQKDGIIDELRGELQKLTVLPKLTEKVRWHRLHSPYQNFVQGREIETLRAELLSQQIKMELLRKANSEASYVPQKIARNLEATQSHMQDRVTDIVTQDKQNRVNSVAIITSEICSFFSSRFWNYESTLWRLD
jgi:hypothetical protein